MPELSIEEQLIIDTYRDKLFCNYSSEYSHCNSCGVYWYNTNNFYDVRSSLDFIKKYFCYLLKKVLYVNFVTNSC